MGSFAWTCCVSGLPVEYGDPVRYLALTQSHRGAHWTSYVHDRWKLRTVPIRGLYNDYGSVEKIKRGLTEKVFFKSFDQDVIEKGVGNNRSHDVQVKRGMSQEKWLEALWEGRVEVDPRYSLHNPNFVFDAAKYDKGIPAGIPTMLRIEKILKRAGYKVSTSEEDGFHVDEVARGFIRIRAGGFREDKKLPPLLPFLDEYAAMITAGTGNYADASEILVAARPGEGRTHSEGLQGQDPDEEEETKTVPVTQAFIREDVWQLLLNTDKLTEDDNSDYPKSFKKYLEGAEQIVRDEDERAQKILEVNKLKGSKADLARLELATLEIRMENGHSPWNPVRAALYEQRDVTFNLGKSYQLAKELDPERKQLGDFLKDLAETLYVETVFSYLRGQWGPTCGAAQFGEWSIHGVFHAKLAKLCAKKVEEQDRDAE